MYVLLSFPAAETFFPRRNEADVPDSTPFVLSRVVRMGGGESDLVRKVSSHALRGNTLLAVVG